MMPSIGELVIRFLEGEDITPRLEKWGVKVHQKGSVFYLTGKVKTAIHRQLDPITCYVCIAFSLFGPYWVFLLREDYRRFGKKADKILRRLNLQRPNERKTCKTLNEFFASH